MKYKRWSCPASLIQVALFAFSACTSAPATPHSSAREPSSADDIEAAETLAADESILTLVGTNDIHGHFVTEPVAEGKPSLGGMQWLAGYVSGIRAATRKRYGDRGKMLLLDAGDAAQGTLISNSNEGQLAASVMSALKYDAGVPGNHAYDFGPVDPAIDQCPIGDSSCQPLGALTQFSHALRFPLLAANVRSKTGNARVPFLKDYVLVPFQGRNIAIVGLENAQTPSTTYRADVASLKFTDGSNEVRQIVSKLKSSGKADVFVLVAHDGDGNGSTEFLDFLKKLNPDASSPIVDAVIAGHTHIKEQGTQNGVPYVQSVWGGKYFGIIHLKLRKNAQGRLEVVRDQTRLKAAIEVEPKPSTFMGEDVRADAELDRQLTEAEKNTEAQATKRIGTLKSSLSQDGKRDADSVIGNFVADAMRAAAQADVAVIGSGDVREGIGHRSDDALLYTDLFDVLPKGLQLVSVVKMPVQMLADNLTLSIESCGHRGALQTSGITLYFERDCSRANPEGIDPGAKLVRVMRSSGEVLYPDSEANQATVDVATTDFVLTGGAGYTAFMKLLKDPGQVKTVGPLRDLMVQQIGKMGAITDEPFKPGRYVNCLSAKDSNCHQ